MPPVQVGTGCAQGTLLSLSAVHIPGNMDVGADILSRQGLRPGEWRLYSSGTNMAEVQQSGCRSGRL